jgi:hypothetical protein
VGASELARLNAITAARVVVATKTISLSAVPFPASPLVPSLSTRPHLLPPPNPLCAPLRAYPIAAAVRSLGILFTACTSLSQPTTPAGNALFLVLPYVQHNLKHIHKIPQLTMAPISPAFVLLSFALLAHGLSSPTGYDRNSDSKTSEQQPEQQQSEIAFWGAADCVDACRSRWGWTGHVFGNDPWGKVLSGGNPVPTSTSEQSTSSTTEADATLKLSTLPTPSVPVNVVPLVTSSSSSTTSSTTPSKPASTSSASSEGAVHIFNAPTNTGYPLPFLRTHATFY